jgi:hypothetical protein
VYDVASGQLVPNAAKWGSTDTRPDVQTKHSLHGWNAVYWLKDHVMSATEWADRYCTPN